MRNVSSKRAHIADHFSKGHWGQEASRRSAFFADPRDQAVKAEYGCMRKEEEGMIETYHL